MSEMDELRAQWKELYSKELPRLAKARDPAQPKWPVTLDHCFARIILDCTIDNAEKQWDKVIKKPAVQNMDEQQLRAAIELGEDIKAGKVDLRELDEKSLLCRGKNEGKYGKADKDSARGEEAATPRTLKRKRDLEEKVEATKVDSKVEDNHRSVFDELHNAEVAVAEHKDREHEEGARREGSPQKSKLVKRQSTLSFVAGAKPSLGSTIPSTSDLDSSIPKKGQAEPDANFQAILQRIDSEKCLTTFRRRLYTTLLSVPRGRFTTYAALSQYLTSSPRAVGSGMRNNPFAPDVPCHRVLAADGSIGGFGGSWGKDGVNAGKKVKLLREEGVRFLGDGKVVGEPFRSFHEFKGMG